MKQIYSWFKYSTLLIIPLLVVIYQQISTNNVYCSDPFYIYILNGLNINLFKLPQFSDTPGVPLTMLTALGLQFIYWFSGSLLDIQTDVLTNPAYYELRLQFILFILILFVTIYSGFYVYKITKNSYLGIITQVVPYLFNTSLTISSANITPDAMLIPVLHLFFMLTVKYVYKVINNEQATNEEWLFPVVCGLALSIKIIIMPILIFPIILFRMNFKKIVNFSGITILSFIVFTLPVVKQYPYMFKWFFSLFINSGIYGKGNATIINPDMYFKNILFIVTNNNLMTILMIFTFIFIFIFYYLKRNGKLRVNLIIYRLFYASLITQLLSILIISKSFDGKDYYLLVTYTFTTLSFVISAIILIINYKIFGIKMVTILLFFIVFSFLINLKKYKEDLLSGSMTQKECIELQQFLSSRSDYNIVTNNTYSFNKNYALLFGVAYSRIHEDKLLQIYPKAFFYNVIPYKFSNWFKEIPPQEIFKDGKVLLADTYISEEEKNKFRENGYEINLVFSNRIKAVYELSILNEEGLDNGERNNYNESIKEKIQSICNDKNWLDLVKEKAKKKNISLDSMLYLDAKWMVDTYGK